MKTKDQFIEWLREKILQNPQEPPATAWEEISHSLELEESWGKIGEELELNSVWDQIDTRLDNFYHLRWFERFSSGVSAAAAAILLLFLWGSEPAQFQERESASPGLSQKIPLTTEERAGAGSSLASDEKAVGMVTAENERSTISEENEISVPVPTLSKQETIISKQGIPENLPKNHFTSSATVEDLRGENEWRNNFSRSRSLRPGIPLVAVLEIEEYEFVPEIPQILPVFIVEEVVPNKDNAYPVAYAGLGAAYKVSWLLNSKTKYAMERNSLLTAVPNFQNDLFLVAGYRVGSKLFFQMDLFMKDVVGQEYKEYRNGKFGKVEDRLEYKSLGLSLSQLRNQIAYGRFPTYSRLTGGAYGGYLESASEFSQSEIISKTEEYERWHAGVLGAYEFDTFLSDQFIFTYGVRSRLDLFNIYSGADQLPADFRKTRAFSLDFSVSFKYLLKK